MRVDLSFLPAYAAAFMLIFARIGTMVMLLPGLGELSVPPRIRLTIALLLAAVLFPLHRAAYEINLQAPGPVLIALAQESDAPIHMLVSSPGGHVESGDAIHDMIRFIGAPVTTIGSGWVASAGTHVYLAAPKERRVCLPNTRFMIHQPAGAAGGQQTDIAIHAREIIKTRERIARVTARETGQPYDKVLADMERDFWLSAEEAIAYGLVSRIVERQFDLMG